MPYKDPAKRKAVQRESQARRRGLQPRRQPLPALAELRFETARDVIAMFQAELSTFLASKGLQASERLRGAVMAGSALLRAFEQVDLVERLEALEAQAPSLRRVS